LNLGKNDDFKLKNGRSRRAKPFCIALKGFSRNQLYIRKLVWKPTFDVLL